MKSSAESMIKGLEEFGFVFTSSQQLSEGEYLSADVEWNYNDVPHLHEVHELAEAVQGAVEDDYAAAILIQKVGFLSFPLTLFNCAISRSENFYFSSFGPYVLLIRTKWSTENQTSTVVTTYFLGSSKVLRLSHKLIHRLLAKNYRTLMEKDLAMRARRGNLRSRKYSFSGDLTGNGFLESLNLAKCGVIAPADLNLFSWECSIRNIEQGATLVGTDDNSGVRLVRQDDLLKIFPRICMHAGASLDKTEFEGSCIVCPWHGKLIKPIFTVDLSKHDETCESSGIRVETKNSMLYIRGLYKSE